MENTPIENNLMLRPRLAFGVFIPRQWRGLPLWQADSGWIWFGTCGPVPQTESMQNAVIYLYEYKSRVPEKALIVDEGKVRLCRHSASGLTGFAAPIATSFPG
jgi:hypothetical protein